MTPRVAVITATKNRRQQLLRCVQSVASQTYSNFEHVIIDDNSGDDTWDLLQELKQQYKHIRAFQIRKPGRGGARGRNYGIRHTQAELITYLDDDDIYYIDHIETLVSHLTTHKGCQFVYCAAHKSDDGEHITAIWETDVWAEDMRAVNLFPICAVMLTRKIWDEVGGMDESIGVYEDWDLWQRLVHVGHVPCFINYPTSIVDCSLNSSIQRDESKERKQEVGQIIRVKLGPRTEDYLTYLRERASLKASTCTTLTRGPVRVTHCDSVRSTNQLKIRDACEERKRRVNRRKAR